MNATLYGALRRAAARALPLVVLAAPAALAPAPAAAQAPARIAVSDTLVEVRLSDGSTLFGRVVEARDERIVLETEAGARVELSRGQIRSLRPMAGTVRGGVVGGGPARHPALLCPHGRSLRAGEGYFGVYELFFPFVTYGVSDRFTLAGGTPIIPGVIGEFAYVGPKVLLVSAPRMQISAGVFAGIFDGGTAGIATASAPGATGQRRHRGRRLGVHHWGRGRRRRQQAAGDAGRRVPHRQAHQVHHENYFVFGEEGALVSGGLRFFGDRLSADAGAGLVYADTERSAASPINFVYSFGRER